MRKRHHQWEAGRRTPPYSTSITVGTCGISILAPKLHDLPPKEILASPLIYVVIIESPMRCRTLGRIGMHPKHMIEWLQCIVE